MIRKKWRKAVPILLGSSFLCSPSMGVAEELTDQTYITATDMTTKVITSGDYTVRQDNVTLDASGYTGNLYYRTPIISTLNGSVNVAISDGNTLTIKGFNSGASISDLGPAIEAYKRGNLGGTMTFTGGNVVISNDQNRLTSQLVTGLYAHDGGIFNFLSNGDNKINLFVFMPDFDTHRTGITLHGNAELNFDGGVFSVVMDGMGGYYNRPEISGIVVTGGAILDVKADQVVIDAAYGGALSIGGTSSTKFNANSILLNGTTGIRSGGGTNTNPTVIEFTGNTRIEAVNMEDNENNTGLSTLYGGQAINLNTTDLTFNSSQPVVVKGENLTPLGTNVERNPPERPESERLDPYWLKTVELTGRSTLVSNADFSLTSNGGYYNSGLYLWNGQAQFNGKTDITIMNGVDTAGAMDVGWSSRAEFVDDLSISLAGTQADYIYGINAEYGGKVDIQKGLFLNDNPDVYWTLHSADADSQIDVNSSRTGTVQVDGDIAARNDGTINFTMNNPNSYLTATSYTMPGGSNSRGTINMDISNNAVWNMTGSSTVTSLTLDRGHVNFMAPSNSGAFKTLTVHGDYVGGGLLTMNTVLGGDDSATDKLIVEGSTTAGTTGLIINNYNGTGAQTVNGIEIITVADQSNGVFELRNRVVGGAYEYNVTKTGNNWYLVNTLIPEPPITEPEPGPGPNPTPTPEPETGGESIKVIRPETGAYIANLAAANTLFTTRLHDRLGETQYTDYLTGETKVTSMWLRQEGGHNRSRIKSGQGKTQSNRYVVQVGGDLAQWSSTGLDRFHVGAMASHGRVQGKTDAKYTSYSAKNKTEGYALGLYGTWYANQADKSGLYVDSWVQYAWFDNTVQGDGLASEKYNSKGWLASLETGYSFKMGENERASYWLQPKAQLTWMGVHADAHREENGTKVTGKGDNLSTRLGLRAYAQGHSSVDDNTGRVFQPFVEANWIHNSKSFGVTMNDTSDSQAGTRNIGELKVGIEGHLSQNLNLWSSVAQQMGDNGYSDTLAILGIKYSF